MKKIDLTAGAVAVLLLSSGACHARQPDDAAAMDRAGLSSPPPPEIRSAVSILAGEMQDHERHGVALRDAVERGDLAHARREAKVLADLRIAAGDDADWRRAVDALNAAARAESMATDVSAASRGLSAIARTCGDCHRSLGPVAIVGDLVPEDGGVIPRMKQHEWAATKLWVGLVVPSDAAWQVGAALLAEAPLAPELLTPDKSPAPRVVALVQAVRDLALRAGRAQSTEDRVNVYADLVSTCSGCHQWLGGGPASPATLSPAR
jgi:mono/diheme cytochrome c family protein